MKTTETEQRLFTNPFETQITDRSLKIGPYSIRPIPTGHFGLDGGAMFGTVPKVLWEKTNPPDAQNRILMEARALLLDAGPDQTSHQASQQTGQDSTPSTLGHSKKPTPRRILIDCGIGGDFIAKYGEKLGAKFSEMYSVQSGNSIETALHSYGLQLADITDVILTHLHFDHAGGATNERNGKLVPTFPNAQYYVQRDNLATASHPNLREKASYFPANFRPLEEAGVLNLLDGPTENLLPGVSVTVSHGHTRGHQVVKISDNSTTLIYCGDLIPTSTHVRLPWIMGYDLHPLTLIEEKRSLLEPAAAQGWYLFFEHDPYMDCARVEAIKGDFSVCERIRLLK